jgi:hypothetical protein
MPRCKVGDLAVCIHGTALGVFVHVVSPSEHPQEPSAPAWLCKVAGPCDVVRTYPFNYSRPITVPAGAKVIFLDRHLQPIRPPKPPEATPAPPVELETT